MGCIKCGREIPKEGGFCERCLKAMEQTPVKQDTVVQILERPAPGERKQPVKREDPRETIAQLRKLIRGLIGWTAILALLVLLLAGALAYLCYLHF